MKRPLESRVILLVISTALVFSEMGLPSSALDLQLPVSNQPQCFGISRGKHFVLGFIDNYDESHLASRELFILVVAFSNQQTTVTISSKHEIAGKLFQETFVIAAGGFIRTTVPDELVMMGTERSLKVLEISASSDVSAYGLMYQDYTTDGFLGLPVSNLGTQYVVITPTATGSWRTQFAVIGTEDSTSVQVTLRAEVTFEGQSYSEGDVLRFVVNELEAVQIQGQVSEDLTGSIIQSDKPVAVFSGHECINHPGSYCDTVTEQLVPVNSWGKKHVYTAARSDDDNIYRIVAFFSETNLTIPGFEDQVLEPGDFWEGMLSGSGLIRSSKPALVMQHLASVNGKTVDPSFIQIPAEEHFGFVFGFTTPPHSGGDSGGYFNFINIIVKNDSRQTVHLNGLPINGSNVFEREVPDTDYTSLTVELPKGAGVYFVEQTDAELSPVSVIVYGYEDDESYGYAAGLSVPSNEQVLRLTPYYLRELGGEVFTVTVPCLQTDAVSVLDAKCRFSTGFGDVLVPGERTDSYTVVCITPTFYKNGLTSVYVSLDNGESFPYSGLVYVASEEDIPPLVNVQQVNSAFGDDIIDLTSDDPIILSWDPAMVADDISHVTVMMQETDQDTDGNPVLMEGVALKTNVLNSGSLMIHPRDFQSISSSGLSLSAFYLTPSVARKRRGLFGGLFQKKNYSGVKKVIKWVTDLPCTVFEGQLVDVASGLPPCPCNSRQGESDLNFVEANFRNDFFHPGARDCYRSTSSSTKGSGQQCCYGADGNLLVGSPGGGTADRYGPEDHLWKHQLYDVLPWLACCKLSNNCDKYYRYRPSDDCSDYEPPRPAGGTGDPHLTSLDGYKFTFNGAGEFLMASSPLHNLTFQARMERYQNTNASVYTAFVLQTNGSSKVQVQMSNMNETLILVDGEPLRLDSIPVKVHHLRGVRIRLNSDLTKINIAFSAGIAVTVYMNTEVMSFIAQLDTKFQGQVQGLLGNLNGNTDDDLQFPNGTFLEPGSSLKELHEFGLEWLMAQEDSIFTYISPFDYNTYHFPEFSPNFEVPDLNQVSQEIKDLCGDSVECIFDAVNTGSLFFANETLVVSGELTEVQKALAVVSCDFPGNVSSGEVHGSHYLMGANLTVTCHDGFTLEGSSELTCKADGRWYPNLPVCTDKPPDGEATMLSTAQLVCIVLFAVIGALWCVGGVSVVIYKKTHRNKVGQSGQG